MAKRRRANLYKLRIMKKKYITKWGEFCATVRRTNLTAKEQNEIIDAAGEACLSSLKEGYEKSKENLTVKYKEI